jgi:hypothetical protein
MDPGARIYASLLNSAAAQLSRLNPKLSETSLAGRAEKLRTWGVKYSCDGKTLTVLEAGEISRGAFHETYLEYVAVFESAYGVNEIWSFLKPAAIKALQPCLEEVRELKLGVPIAKYALDYVIFDNIFRSSDQFNYRSLFPGTVLITTRELTFQGRGGPTAIPLSSVVTVDREVYMGYGAGAAQGVIRALDYQVKATGLSCAVFMARKELMADFMRVVSIARNEERRLSRNEGNVLIALYNGVPRGDIPEGLGIGADKVGQALARIQESGLAEASGRLTATGINTAIQIIRSLKE